MRESERGFPPNRQASTVSRSHPHQFPPHDVTSSRTRRRPSSGNRAISNRASRSARHPSACSVRPSGYVTRMLRGPAGSGSMSICAFPFRAEERIIGEDSTRSPRGRSRIVRGPKSALTQALIESVVHRIARDEIVEVGRERSNRVPRGGEEDDTARMAASDGSRASGRVRRGGSGHTRRPRGGVRGSSGNISIRRTTSACQYRGVPMDRAGRRRPRGGPEIERRCGPGVTNVGEASSAGHGTIGRSRAISKSLDTRHYSDQYFYLDRAA